MTIWVFWEPFWIPNLFWFCWISFEFPKLEFCGNELKFWSRPWKELFKFCFWASLNWGDWVWVWFVWEGIIWFVFCPRDDNCERIEELEREESDSFKLGWIVFFVGVWIEFVIWGMELEITVWFEEVWFSDLEIIGKLVWLIVSKN